MSSQVLAVFCYPTYGATLRQSGLLFHIWNYGCIDHLYQETWWKHGRSNQQQHLVQCHLSTDFELCIPHGQQCGTHWWFLSGLAMGYILPDREGVRTTLIEKWLAILFLISIPLSIGMSVWNMWDIVINKAPFLCYG